MTVYTYVRGNEVPLFEESDIDEQQLPCTRCGHQPTIEGHDHCLGHLPGVTHACCGHGITGGHIRFENGTILTFNDLNVKKYGDNHELERRRDATREDVAPVKVVDK